MKLRTKFNTALAAGFLCLSFAQGSAKADTVPITVCDPLFTCAGTPTEGWDGPGLNAVTIDYFVGNPNLSNWGIPTSLITDYGSAVAALPVFDAAISAAQAIWSAVVDVTWNRVGDALNNTLDWGEIQTVIYSASGDHSDGNPFDGAWDPSDLDPSTDGHVLAHAYGPPDIASGNLHLDDDEWWVTSGASIGTTSATIDLVSILAHEFGHVLGLGHPGSNSGDLMQPKYFGPLTTLSADDIAAVRSLYACAGADCDTNGGGTTVPEPGTLWLFLSGPAALMLSRRRRPT